MISIAVILVAFLCSKQALADQGTIVLAPLAATCSEETLVQVFTSVFVIDLISAHDPVIVFGLRLAPEVAAKRLYAVNLRIFRERGFRNAESIASTVARAVNLVQVFTLPLYYLNVGTVVGRFFAAKGIADCGNVIERATEYFENEQRSFHGLDPAQLESYVVGVAVGLEDLLEELGFSIEENEVNWQILVDWFYTEYNKYVFEPHAYL